MDAMKGSDAERRQEMSRYCEQSMGMRVGLLLLACAVLLGAGCAPSASARSRVSVGGDYYAEDFEFLAQYGEWMGVPPYGIVWCPYVDERWAPFYDGRWIWTSDGWAWDSYEPFGELVYHYGYWYHDNDIGWFWMPGDEWSPARVQWYSYGGYCGWAPLPPPNYYWPDPWDYYDHDVWVVVHIDNFCDDHIGHHAIDQPREMLRRDIAAKNKELLRRDVDVKIAPDVRQVKRFAGREIPVRTIEKRTLDTGVSRQIAKNTEARGISQTRREIAAPRQNIQPQREVAAPREPARDERKTAAAREPARDERKVESPARSVQPAQSRAADRPKAEERSSERAVKKTANR
jgi:hypothetical protein